MFHDRPVLVGQEVGQPEDLPRLEHLVHPRFPSYVHLYVPAPDPRPHAHGHVDGGDGELAGPEGGRLSPTDIELERAALHEHQLGRRIAFRADVRARREGEAQGRTVGPCELGGDRASRRGHELLRKREGPTCLYVHVPQLPYDLAPWSFRTLGVCPFRAK